MYLLQKKKQYDLQHLEFPHQLHGEWIRRLTGPTSGGCRGAEPVEDGLL
jgi:hypothetical protein